MDKDLNIDKENVHRLAPSGELLEKEGDKQSKFIIHGNIVL